MPPGARTFQSGSEKSTSTWFNYLSKNAQGQFVESGNQGFLPCTGGFRRPSAGQQVSTARPHAVARIHRGHAGAERQIANNLKNCKILFAPGGADPENGRIVAVGILVLPGGYPE
jgi:hypothetical protein